MTAVITVPVPPGRSITFAGWQQRMNEVVATADGFISTEVVDPVSPGDDFVVIYRFASTKHLQTWLHSSQRLAQLAELPADLDTGDETMSVFVGHEREHQEEPVTAVISVRVRAGNEGQYREWQKRMADVMGQQPGSIGWTVQEPIPGLQDDWVVMTRFDSETHLNGWLQSETRAKMLAEADGMIEQSRTKRTRASFDGWFHFTDGQRPPKAWQQSALVLLVLFPVVMLEVAFLSQYTGKYFNLSEQTFIGNAISVGLTGFVLIPIAAYCFRWWLKPGISTRRRWLGAFILLVLYAISIKALGYLPPPA
ncbi:MAG: antibiotic biosynthesis monooxygenase [Actinobacteria bacterium]|nr:antibiotic biosynthesis monooxygenase [Actinomycetota bacterium]